MKFEDVTNIVELHNVYKVLSALDKSYPNFHYWYFNKVIPSVLLHKDKVIAGYVKGELAGISIIKKTEQENKLRALRISDRFQKRGFGLHLIDKSLKELEDDKPLVSVNGSMLDDFSRIFINRYNFDLVSVHKGLYVKGELEYQFNGNKHSLLKTSLPY